MQLICILEHYGRARKQVSWVRTSSHCDHLELQKHAEVCAHPHLGNQNRSGPPAVIVTKFIITAAVHFILHQVLSINRDCHNYCDNTFNIQGRQIGPTVEYTLP